MNILIKLEKVWRVVIVVLICITLFFVLHLASKQKAESRVALTQKKVSEELENGAWLWRTVLTMSSEYRDSIMQGAKDNGINTIYLSIDTYLDVLALKDELYRTEQKNRFNSALDSFVQKAHENGIKVDAVAGRSNWTEEKNRYKVDLIIEYVKEYNRTHEVKLRGLQFDIESYTLDSYQKDPKKVLIEFLNLVDDTVRELKDDDIRFSIAIPEFYDSNSMHAPKFFYKGRYRYMFDHLLSIFEKKPGSSMLIMGYRNKSLGPDGSINLSYGEVMGANKSYTKILVGTETSEVEPTSITFHGMPKSIYIEQVQYIRDAFEESYSFGGIATHHLESLLKLK